MASTIVSPHATEYQAGTYPSLLNSLNNTTSTTLNDSTVASNTNAEWGLEWDATIQPGQSLVISFDEQISAIPEPSAGMAFIGLGGLFLMRPRRRDEDPDGRSVTVAEA